MRVRANSVNFGDLLARNFEAVTPGNFSMPWFLWLVSKMYFGWKDPKIKVLGSEFAGEVEAVGEKVSCLKTGDRVFGYLGQAMGGYAEYLCLPENAVVIQKLSHLTFEEAAVMPYEAIMAWGLLKKVSIKSGEQVLIIGASGGIGSAAVHLAKYLGAEVTGVCSTAGLDYVRSLGASTMVDYTQTDFTQLAKKYDLILDVPGKSSIKSCKNALKTNGRVLFAGFKSKHLFHMLWSGITGGKKVICALVPESMETFNTVKSWMDSGVLKPGLDRYFPIEQAREAHRSAESSQKRGHVAIRMD